VARLSHDSSPLRERILRNSARAGTGFDLVAWFLDNLRARVL